MSLLASSLGRQEPALAKPTEPAVEPNRCFVALFGRVKILIATWRWMAGLRGERASSVSRSRPSVSLRFRAQSLDVVAQHHIRNLFSRS